MTIPMTNGGMVEQARYHQCIGGTGPVPPLVMQIHQAAPMYWWDWLAAPELMVHYKGDCHVSSTSKMHNCTLYIVQSTNHRQPSE